MVELSPASSRSLSTRNSPLQPTSPADRTRRVYWRTRRLRGWSATSAPLRSLPAGTPDRMENGRRHAMRAPTRTHPKGLAGDVRETTPCANGPQATGRETQAARRPVGRWSEHVNATSSPPQETGQERPPLSPKHRLLLAVALTLTLIVILVPTLDEPVSQWSALVWRTPAVRLLAWSVGWLGHGFAQLYAVVLLLVLWRVRRNRRFARSAALVPLVFVSSGIVCYAVKALTHRERCSDDSCRMNVRILESSTRPWHGIAFSQPS